MTHNYFGLKKLNPISTLIIALCLLFYNYSFAFQSPIITPIEVTGYNHDVIANGTGDATTSTDTGLDSGDFVLISKDFKPNASSEDLTIGLPSNGLLTSSSIEGLTFQFNSTTSPYNTNNSLRISNTDISLEGALTLNVADNYSKLYLLVTSGNGSSTITVSLHFLDGSTQVVDNLTVPDWYQTGDIPIEVSGIGRVNRLTNAVETPTNNPKLFRLSINIDATNQLKDLTSISFEKTNTSDNSVLNVFAISGQAASDCITPYNIITSEITTTSAQLTWSSLSGDNFEILVQSADLATPQGAGNTVSDTVFTATNLLPNTAYN